MKTIKYLQSDERILSLNKNDFLEQCKLLGLNHSGNKDPLIEILKKVRDDGQCYLSSEYIDNPDIEQWANNRFDPNARWEILNESDNKVLLEDELEIGDVNYRAPINPYNNFEQIRDGDGAVSKFNLIK